MLAYYLRIFAATVPDLALCNWSVSRADPGFLEGGLRSDGNVLEWTIGRVATAQAVLGVGVERGRPLPQQGSGGVTPGKFFQFYFTVYEFWCI